MEDYELNNPPQTLQNVFEYFENNGVSLNAHDTFIVFLYVLMLETGFIPKDFADDSANDSAEFFYPRMLQMSKKFPGNWKLDRSYYINFVLPCLPADICKFFCLVSGEDILATCTIPNSKIGYSFLFDPTVYIVKNNSKVFQNLKGLSITFKNAISFPLKVFVLSMYNIPHNSLLYLPYETLLDIMKYLNKFDIANLCRTCRRFENIHKDPKLRSIMSNSEGYLTKTGITLLNHHDDNNFV